MTASDEAARFLNGRAPADPGERRAATGERARLRDLLLRDRLDDDETAELEELSKKFRDGDLEGRPPRTVRRRQSVAGDGDRDGGGRGRATPPTASQRAAEQLRGW